MYDVDPDSFKAKLPNHFKHLNVEKYFDVVREHLPNAKTFKNFRDNIRDEDKSDDSHPGYVSEEFDEVKEISQ